jgi:hypothetical protein
MPRDEQSKLTPHAILGVVIALMGVIFTLDNLGLADTGAFVRYWPVLPIVIGVIMLMHADTVREWVFGSAWMTGGGILLARSLGWLDFRLKDFLPLLLVVVGVRLIWRDQYQGEASSPRPGPAAGDGFDAEPAFEPGPEAGRAPAEQTPLDQPPPIPPPPPQFSTAPPYGGAAQSAPEDPWRRRGRRRHGADWAWPGFSGHERTPWQHWESWQSWRGRHWRPRLGHIRMLALMSGVERRLRSEVFASAEMTAIMGACELDLRQAEMSGGDAHISAFALWGGIEIRVPEHWVVVNRSMALMGGVEDTTRHSGGPNRRRLFVHGFALMAGIEIKN